MKTLNAMTAEELLHHADECWSFAEQKPYCVELARRNIEYEADPYIPLTATHDQFNRPMSDQQQSGH